MKIIMLDIDGVLNYFNDADLVEENKQRSKYLEEYMYTYMNKDLVKKFTDFVNSYPDIRIVISSSWRGLYPDLKTMVDDFEDMGLPKDRIIDRTPRLNIQRGGEILSWIRQNSFNGEYCILDDCADMFPIMEKLIQTDGEIGLTEDILERIKKMLKLENKF